MRYLFYGFGFLLYSCSLLKSEPTKEECFTAFVQKADIDVSDFQSVLFIPLEGCEACIHKGIDFYEQNADNTDILFVFCTYKPFEYNILKNIDNYNVMIDETSKATKNHILDTAPVAFKKEGDVFKFLGVANSQFNFSLLY